MAKTIPNPLDPEKSAKDYEREVGDIIERSIRDNARNFLINSFKHLVDDYQLLIPLSDVQVRRRTNEKPKWKGASGYEHHIDESFSTEDERIIILVECKHYSRCIGIPEFSTFLVRVMDIATEKQDRLVLGILVTTQGHQGRGGGREEDRDGVAKLQTHFGKIGYPIAIQVLADFI